VFSKSSFSVKTVKYILCIALYTLHERRICSTVNGQLHVPLGEKKGKRGGVGIMLREDLAKDVVEVQRMSSRVMSIKMILDRKSHLMHHKDGGERKRRLSFGKLFAQNWVTSLE